MKRPTLVAAGSLQRILQTAEAAWERRDFAQCLDALQSASRLAPANTGILLQLGRIHGLRYDYAAAGACFEQALRMAPRKTEMLMAIVNHCENFRNPDLTERYLRRTLEQPDTPPPVFVKLAELYERLRRLPEAKELVDRVLTTNPSYPAALLVRARLERTAGRLEAAEAVLNSFLTKPVPDVWIHAQGCYELGQNLDRQNRFDEAMQAFLQAKSLLRPQAAPYLAELKAFRARLKVMETKVTPEILQRWHDQAPSLAPTRRFALLCGHARSGTTLLEQVLDAHPDVVSVEETETFFDEAFGPLRYSAPPNAYMLDVLETADTPKLQALRAAYFRSMEHCLGSPIADRLLIDKNPMFTYLIPAFIRILPETRFLVALRDPRDVVMSCFMQKHLLNPVTASYLSLEGTAQDYAETMSLWRTLKPLIPGRYLEVRYEDMVADLEPVARQTLEFLGVPWDDRVLGFDEHARKKMVRSPTYADVTQKVYTRARGRWRNYEKYMEPCLAVLEPFVKEFGYE